MITYQKKTREELIASFKRAIERKKQWEEESLKEFADIRRRGTELSHAIKP
jgi:hypothetical protein